MSRGACGAFRPNHVDTFEAPHPDPSKHTAFHPFVNYPPRGVYESQPQLLTKVWSECPQRGSAVQIVCDGHHVAA